MNKSMDSFAGRVACFLGACGNLGSTIIFLAIGIAGLLLHIFILGPMLTIPVLVEYIRKPRDKFQSANMENTGKKLANVSTELFPLENSV